MVLQKPALRTLCKLHKIIFKIFGRQDYKISDPEQCFQFWWNGIRNSRIVKVFSSFSLWAG